ncbi:MAG TPA: hypothetical protein VHR45_20385 [Thermoanaerobaculia bacterium]|nr:hypothetical protein [Thermoanaerobaculia bacterium]
MPVTHEVNHERRRTTTTAIGPITMADIREHLSAEGRDRGLGYPEVIDATRATAVFGAQDVRTTVEILRELGREGALGPTAIVVGDEVSYGMFRMLEALVEDVCDVRPFRSHQEAENWLAHTPIRKPAMPPVER